MMSSRPHWRTLLFCSLTLTLCLMVPAAVSDPGEAPGSHTLNPEEFSGVLVRSGNIYIAGQPSRAGLELLKQTGVGVVVNLRTPNEMASLEFSEPTLLGDLGIHYVSLPSGGSEHPYSKETLQAFAEIVEQADADVLLHCRSAARASHLWVAYLVKYRGVSLPEALERGRAINFGTAPIEGYLEGEIEYRIAPLKADESF
ncbi:MAG: sulfur transferase domain-containing protein [Pseudomonadales bacterium]